MKRVLIFLSVLTILKNVTAKSPEEIEPIDMRIKHLKQQLMGDTSDAKLLSKSELSMYDYIDNSRQPITPISEDDKRKLEGRFKQPEVITTTAKDRYVASPETNEKETKLRYAKRKKKSPGRSKKLDKEIFYRRAIDFDITDRDKPQKWTHCLDLLSPFLNGFLHNGSSKKRVFASDPSIRRLIYILTLNMTGSTTSEIRSTLYELSNVPVRVFQWDTSAVKAIIRAIVRGGRNDFKGLKDGLKFLFEHWKLNTSNLTRLLTQSRIFRPPCIQITEYGGSTVTQKPIRYTKPNENESGRGRTIPAGDEDC